MSFLLAAAAVVLGFGDGVGEQSDGESRALPSPAQLMTGAAQARFGSNPVSHDTYSLQAKCAAEESSITFFAAAQGPYRFIRWYRRAAQVLPAVNLGSESYPQKVISAKDVIGQESGFDGKHAWSRSKDVLLPSWVAPEFRDTRFGVIESIHHVVRHALSPWAAQSILDEYASARTIDVHSFMEVDCYAVDLTAKDGRKDRLYVEEQSGHIRGFIFDVQGKFAPAPMTWALQNYADVEGVMLPQLLTLTTTTTTEFRVTKASFVAEGSQFLDAPPRLGEGLLDASLEFLDGERVVLRDGSDGKPVLLFFGGSGCGPSFQARKKIEGWLKNANGGLTCYGIDTFSADDKMIRRFLPSDGSIKAIRDAQGQLASICGVAAVPAAVLIDSSGQVTALPDPRQNAFWETLEREVASR